jgi:uroporphyrinogen decarboxylase
MPEGEETPRKTLLRALNGEVTVPPPIWLMRQAGRYLPEYRALRGQAETFLDFCFNPDLAVEATLQPIRRYGFDAAIVFSDILVVPHALGQKVWFEGGKGPRLEALREAADIDRLTRQELGSVLAPVYRTVRLVREQLAPDVALIGFAGAPWTVATYMIEGGSSRDFALAKAWMTSEPQGFARLIGLLVDATADHLIAQADAGAEALQIFDSWAGALIGEALQRWSVAPLRGLVERVKAAHPDVPIILFPRGVGDLYDAFAEDCGADAVSLDSTVPLGWAKRTLQPRVAVQGNLDPQILMAGGPGLEQACRDILGCLADGPFIFNLGHGILPETPLENVSRMIEIVRDWQP